MTHRVALLTASSLRLAWRNVRKRGRRSLLTVVAIALGFAAINVFGGFVHYVSVGLVEGYVYAQARGHLTIVRHEYLRLRATQPLAPLIDEASQALVVEMLEAMPEVSMLTRELHVSGRVEHAGRARGYYALGRIASEVTRINDQARGVVSQMRVLDGSALRDQEPGNVVMSAGLAQLLEAETGDQVTLVASNVSGARTRRDVDVVSLIPVPAQQLGAELMLIPMPLAQDLLDTQAVDRFTVLLRRGADVDRVRRALQRQLNALDMDMDVWSLSDLDPSTTRIAGMFETIFRIMAAIIFAIATMSVMNTITMAILERTREIGTLRALGLTVNGVLRLFALESAILALFGSLLGAALTLGGWVLFQVLEPTWAPPYVDMVVPLEIDLVPSYLLGSTVLMIVLAVLGTVRPARQAARRSIAMSLASQ